MRKGETMTPEFVIGFARQSIELALMIAMPMLGIGLLVGIVVSVIQALSLIHISEPTRR